jgi:predicted enzyme related to lactoylglutathione lyase
MNMSDAKTFVANVPSWLDLSSTDPARSRDFYGKVFGWKIDVGGPETRGYGMAKTGDKFVAGIGPNQDPNAPSAWMIYIGTRDVDALAKKVEAAGGKVVAPPMKVMESGRMVVFQDPVGAYFAAWEPNQMNGFDVTSAPDSFGWGELNARGIDKATAFYTKVFGWSQKTSDMGDANPPYTEFKHDGQSILGAMEMNPMVPQEVPSYWMAYFTVADVDKAHGKATDLGAREMMEPQDFPGGRFSILSDPQGAVFGLLKMETPR